MDRLRGLRVSVSLGTGRAGAAVVFHAVSAARELPAATGSAADRELDAAPLSARARHVMFEVNDNGTILRRTRANQPPANRVNGDTLCFIIDEGKIERSNGLIWESYSASPVDVTTAPAMVNMKQGVGALIVFLSQGPNAVLNQEDAEHLLRIIDGEAEP